MAIIQIIASNSVNVHVSHVFIDTEKNIFDIF